jgi:CRP/FNR family nitrogen fixation transcriptional regulator
MQVAAGAIQRPDRDAGWLGAAGATSAVLDALERFGCAVDVQRAHAIYDHGEPTEFCWMILSGCARTVQVMEDGRRHIDEFLWPGDLIGMDDLGTHCAGAEAVTDMMLRRYPRRLVETLAQRDLAFALWLRTIALASLRYAHRQMALLGRKTAVERIASFLLEMDTRSAPVDGRLVRLPMSRADIGDHLGLSNETVCRNLARLQRRGVLSILRSGIVLSDRGALRELSGQSPTPAGLGLADDTALNASGRSAGHAESPLRRNGLTGGPAGAWFRRDRRSALKAACSGYS